jgi:hypothetical protein
MSEREGSDADIFMIDLHAGFPNLAAKTTTLRLREALQDHARKAVYISHIGGFPVRKIASDTYTVLGQEITPEFMQKHLIEALGASAALTHMNPRNRSIEEFGERCLADGHTWCLHNVIITLCFVNFSPFVEVSFSRDGSFTRGASWVETPVEGVVANRIFTVPGSIKAWQRYVRFQTDPSFHSSMREAMTSAWWTLNWLCGDTLFPSMGEIRAHELEAARKLLSDYENR